MGKNKTDDNVILPKVVLSENQKDAADSYKSGVKAQKRSGKLILTLSIALSLLVGGTAGATIYHFVSESEDDGISPLTKEIYNYLKTEWLYAGSYADFEKTFNDLMIAGMLDNDGDPYTFYTSTYADQGLDTSGAGKYGASLSDFAASAAGQTYGGLRVNSLVDGTFRKAGFEVGDVIIACKHPSDADYTYIDTLTPSEAVSFIKPSDAEGKETVSFRLIRDGAIMNLSCGTGSYSEIPASLLYDGSNGTGQHIVTIRISTFLGGSDSGYPSDMAKSIITQAIKDKGAIDSLIFDCRDNGGGYTDEAYKLACLFLPKGKIVYQMGDNNGNITKVYRQESDPAFSSSDIKSIKIILNGGSASATELFAKALHDNGMAVTYGTKSYGKGIAQSVINLKNGGTLRITTGKVYGPDGLSVQGVGITPEVASNTYYTYTSDLVSTPYVADSYRLTYEQEQAVLADLKMFDSYKSYDDFAEALKAFQADEGLTPSGHYDTYTLYRLYGKLLTEYYAGAAAELTSVEGI